MSKRVSNSEPTVARPKPPSAPPKPLRISDAENAEAGAKAVSDLIDRLDEAADKSMAAAISDMTPDNLRRLRAAIDASLPPQNHLRGKDEMLRLAVAAVLEADTEFRSNMMPGWEGDPLSDEIDGLRRIFEASPASQNHLASRADPPGSGQPLGSDKEPALQDFERTIVPSEGGLTPAEGQPFNTAPEGVIGSDSDFGQPSLREICAAVVNATLESRSATGNFGDRTKNNQAFETQLTALGEFDHRLKCEFSDDFAVTQRDLEDSPTNGDSGSDILTSNLASGFEGLIIGQIVGSKIGTFKVFLKDAVFTDIEVVPGHVVSLEPTTPNPQLPPAFQPPPQDHVDFTGRLARAARAFLHHFNPTDLPEDVSQQWQALEHLCGLASTSPPQPREGL